MQFDASAVVSAEEFYRRANVGRVEKPFTVTLRVPNGFEIDTKMTKQEFRELLPVVSEAVERRGDSLDRSVHLSPSDEDVTAAAVELALVVVREGCLHNKEVRRAVSESCVFDPGFRGLYASLRFLCYEHLDALPINELGHYCHDARVRHTLEGACECFMDGFTRRVPSDVLRRGFRFAAAHGPRFDGQIKAFMDSVTERMFEKKGHVHADEAHLAGLLERDDLPPKALRELCRRLAARVRRRQNV